MGYCFSLVIQPFTLHSLKVPIANATVLFLVSPFFITIMSIIVFGSLVGVSRWITMVIGFSGVIVIAQPESGDFNFFYILPVITALTYAVSMVIAKLTAKKDDLFQQVIYMYLITATVSGVIGLGMGDGRFNTAELVEYQFLTQSWQFDQITAEHAVPLYCDLYGAEHLLRFLCRNSCFPPFTFLLVTFYILCFTSK